MKFVIGSPDGGLVTLFAEKSRSSTEVALMGEGDKVTAIPHVGGNDPEWHFVTFDREVGGPDPIEGWVEVRFLKEREADTGPRLPLEIEPFVRSCARAELVANAAGGDVSSTIVADYLLAWANIESGEPARGGAEYTNPAPDADGAEGPFRLTQGEWKAYMDTVNEPEPYVSEFEISISTSQVAGATFVVLQEIEAFSKLATRPAEPEDAANDGATASASPSDGAFVPSYLNALHCRLVGVPAAFRLHTMMQDGQSGASVTDALSQAIPDEAERAKVFARRAAYLGTQESPVTVERFHQRTSDALSKGFKLAYRHILTHASYLLPPPSTVGGTAPWLDVAEQEFGKWRDGGFVETGGAGLQRVIEYFKSVNPAIRSNRPWCGAFAGFCMEHSTPSLKATIVREGARAANWVNWGNTRLRIHHLRDIPVGAVVVTVPLAPRSSGHVGFFLSKVEGQEKIVLFGGNQSESVTKTMQVNKNDIREIRWLDTGDPTPDATADTTPVSGSPVNATRGEVLTMARTLYGEARGESRKGIEAVANVIINRVRRRFFGRTVEGVCRWPSQFSCWDRTDANFSVIVNQRQGTGNAIFDLCFSIAEAAVRGTVPLHVTDDTLHYHATYIGPPSWVRNSRNPRVTLREGGHIFYSQID